jgi:hypothetical protein
MKTLTIQLTGIGALLTHNERLASKLDPIARDMAAISGKRKKTDDDLAELARLEFLGGLYETPDHKVGFPSWNVFRAIQEGARINKLGRHIERALTPTSNDIVPVHHNGPNTPKAMWETGCFDQRSVKVGTSKITRTRPMFLGWSLTVDFVLDTEILNLDDLILCVDNAGRLVGIGDYRPRFGRFDAIVKEA